MIGSRLGKTAAVVLLLAVCWLLIVFLPFIIYENFPQEFTSFLDGGGALASVIVVVGFPICLGFLALISLVVWLSICRLFAPRSVLEQLLLASMLGGHLGRFETRLLDYLYSNTRS